VNHAVACALEIVLILQFVVLVAHDTIPLGRWNNLHHFRAVVPLRRRVIGSVANSATGILALVLYHLGRMHGSMGSLIGLIVLQAVLFFGELSTWWRPYFFGASPDVVAHLRPNWEGTIGFIPEKHGIALNAVHCIMHALTLAALILAIAEHSSMPR
jgi:hypothetical protein